MKMFTNYREYLADNPKGYWFKRKVYGWGWTPAKKEGWFATVAYLLIIIGAVSAAELRLISETTGIGLFIISTILFVVLCWRTGEPPKWQWGVPPSGS